jgi:hypothetical protein
MRRMPPRLPDPGRNSHPADRRRYHRRRLKVIANSSRGFLRSDTECHFGRTWSTLRPVLSPVPSPANPLYSACLGGTRRAGTTYLFTDTFSGILIACNKVGCR